jgi:hypothetical protein
MKKQKVKLPNLRVKSMTTSTPRQIKVKSQKNDGGYTWVG